MAYSYDEILERMSDKYYELAGEEAERMSDSGIKLRLLAGEIFSLETNIDWLKRQMFASTATGEELDKHAAQRGLERFRGKKASGALLLKVDVPVEYDIVIPMGTIFTTWDGRLNFISTEEVIIYKGTGYTFVEVEAEKSGSEYNVGLDEVTTIVTYFSIGLGISNTSVFLGGTDDESDEALRKRIAESMKNIPNGANLAFYRSLAMSVDGVQSVSFGGENTNSLSVYVAGRGEMVSSNAIVQIQTLLNENKIPGTEIRVYNAAVINMDLNVRISIKSGYVVSDVIAKVENAVRNYFLDLSVGQDAILAEIGSRIINVDGVRNYEFVDAEDKTAQSLQLLRLMNLSVSRKI